MPGSGRRREKQAVFIRKKRSLVLACVYHTPENLFKRNLFLNKRRIEHKLFRNSLATVHYYNTSERLVVRLERVDKALESIVILMKF